MAQNEYAMASTENVNLHKSEKSEVGEDRIMSDQIMMINQLHAYVESRIDNPDLDVNLYSKYEVLLQLKFSRDGNLELATVKKSCGVRAFDDIAMQAVQDFAIDTPDGTYYGHGNIEMPIRFLPH